MKEKGPMEDVYAGINKYLKKTAVEERSCFVCHKSTNTVLSNNKDWFYACNSHLNDYYFCTILEYHVNKDNIIKKDSDSIVNKSNKDKESANNDVDKDKKNDKNKDSSDDKSSGKAITEFYSAFKAAVINDKESSKSVDTKNNNNKEDNIKIPKTVKLHSSFWYLRQVEAKKRNNYLSTKNKLSSMPSVPQGLPSNKKP